ncbi:MAG TPA: hypothetical protein VJS92_16165 [Candidatus Polarisedimenticolaceae bacterium]|nr:hypothetical protein [Candidatus Polarisedimenticolaceae bacterium]
MRRVLGSLVAAALAVAFVAFALTVFTATPAVAVIKPCICPDVYAPVICSNGVVYSNSCRASCAHATGCHPYGAI